MGIDGDGGLCSAEGNEGKGEMGIGLGLRGERGWALEAGPEEKGLRLDLGWALSLTHSHLLTNKREKI